MKLNYNRSKLWLRFMFVLGVGAVLLLGLLTSFALQFILIKTEVLTREMINESPMGWIVLFLGTRTVVGLSLSPLFSKIILKPVNILIDGMGKLSEGDYSTRIHLGKVKETKALEEARS
jgi:sensor histidine kinase YesM